MESVCFAVHLLGPRFRWDERTGAADSIQSNSALIASESGPLIRPAFLANKASRRCLRLRANRLRTLQTCRASVPGHVGDARPDRHFEHRHSKYYADGGNVPAAYQA